ncbi:MAG: flagellar hook-basal body complex protein FliE [Desulfococcaceae bacterium]
MAPPPLQPVSPEVFRIPESRPAERAGGFGNVLSDALNSVGALHREKDAAIRELAAGEAPDVHSTMIAIQRADLSFRFLMQVRNKAVAAYQEIMRMNI